MEILRLFNAVGKCLFVLVDFIEVIVKLSYHSILVELFGSISILYKFTIHMLRYVSPVASSSLLYGTVIQCLRNQ
jgi:hypothetical protein